MQLKTSDIRKSVTSKVQALSRPPEDNAGKPSVSNTAAGDSVSLRDSAAEKPTSGGSLGRLVAGVKAWAGFEEKAEDNSRRGGAEPLNLERGELLGRFAGASPEKVSQLQEMLRSEGAKIEVDGKFGPRTDEAVKNFQEAHGLKVDGLVGPETLGALNRQDKTSPNASPELGLNEPKPEKSLGRVSLSDSNASPAEQFEHYKNLIEANGGKINPDGATVLGLRGLGVDGARHDGSSNLGGYDDSFVVLNKDAQGNPTVRLFQGATHANQRTSGASIGRDKDGKTVRGVAMLQPGNYDVDFSSGNYQGRWGSSYYVKTLDGNGLVPAYRDTNKDGSISVAEREAAVSRGFTASAILFHNGKYAAPSSIGCQTILPSQHRAFSESVGRASFNYTLLNANEALIPR
jgi:peptidoglycan hydrolase-like protein with peptidoglycan-binding domain